MSWKSLADRKRVMLEDCCGGGGDGGGPTMTAGADGFQSAAPAEGPRAGYDPILGKAMRKRDESRKRRNVKEGYKQPNTDAGMKRYHELDDEGKYRKAEKVGDYHYQMRRDGNESDADDEIGTNATEKAREAFNRMPDEKRGRRWERRNRMRGVKKGYTKDINIMSKNSSKGGRNE